MAITKATVAAKTAAVSLNPDTFAAGGGLLDDAVVTVTDAAFVLWDYMGKAKQGPALALSMKDEEDKEHDQYFSAGDKKFFVPSGDGEYLTPVGDKEALISSTNAAQFLTSLVNAGFPKDRLDEGKISILKGLVVHVHREAQQKRAGLAQAREDGREATILLVDKIVKLPWEKGGGSGRAATKPDGAEAAEGEAQDPGDQLMGIILAELTESGEISKAKLPALVTAKTAKTDPNRAKMLKLAFNEGFLKDGPWEYKGGKLTAA